jgi:hypothetical protein
MKHAAPGAAAKVPLLSLARPALPSMPSPLYYPAAYTPRTLARRAPADSTLFSSLADFTYFTYPDHPSRPGQPSPWPLQLTTPTVVLVRLLHCSTPLSGVDCDRPPANR